MDNRTCSVEGCENLIACRGYCKPCYQKARRSGELTLKRTLPRHTLTDVDLGSSTATCGICGPTEISVHGSRRECIVVRRRTTAYRRPEGIKPRIRNEYPEPLAPQDYRLRREYGITLAQYQEMSDAQGGLCLICRTKPERLVVDHCHTEGHVRGLLCGRCNVGLGMFRDTPEFLLAAANYVGT